MVIAIFGDGLSSTALVQNVDYKSLNTLLTALVCCCFAFPVYLHVQRVGYSIFKGAGGRDRHGDENEDGKWGKGTRTEGKANGRTDEEASGSMTNYAQSR